MPPPSVRPKLRSTYIPATDPRRAKPSTLKSATNQSNSRNGSNSPQSAHKSPNRSATRKSVTKNSTAPNRSDHAKDDIIINKIDELSTKTNEIIERLEEIKTHRDDKEQRKIRQRQRTNRLIPFHGF